MNNLHHRKLTCYPRTDHFKRKIVFQAAFFTGYVSFWVYMLISIEAVPSSNSILASCCRNQKIPKRLPWFMIGSAGMNSEFCFTCLSFAPLFAQRRQDDSWVENSRSGNYPTCPAAKNMIFWRAPTY